MKIIHSALCVHARADDLAFLRPVRNRMKKLLGDRLQNLELSSDESHIAAKLALRTATEGLVVVFAHGGSSYLRGGDYYNRQTGVRGSIEKFLVRDEMDVFSGKVVFCLSCDSNGLADSTINAGAIAFVGFDAVPLDRFDLDGNPVGTHVLVKHTKELVLDAIKATMERFVTGQATLDEAVGYLRIWIDKHVVDYVRKYNTVPERREVAALLLRIKSGVHYHGERDIRFDPL